MADTTTMSDAETALNDAPDSHDDHAGGHGHAPAGEPLGPVDVTAWVYSITGGVAGLLVALVLLVARGG